MSDNFTLTLIAYMQLAARHGVGNSDNAHTRDNLKQDVD